jgi:hypothetical protein
MKPRRYRIAWLALIVLMAASLSCNAINRVGDARETVQAVATSVSQGRDLLATLGAVGTQVGGAGWLETAQALATLAGESGLLETAVAFATEQGPSALATAQAFATEQGPAAIATAQAFATQQGPSAMATAQAYATQVAGSLGNLPPDVPIVDGEKDAFVKSLELVSYITPIEYAQVVDFYKQQMPANGWVQASSGWIETAQTTILRVEKPDRLATVTITRNPVDGRSVVLITIQAR